jgi:putative ABC transport system permease protein
MGLVLSMAWRNLLRHRRRTALTALMMGMAVAMSMVILCLAAGSTAQMREVLVTGTLGHVQVVNPEWPGRRPMDETVDEVDALVTALSARPGVAGVAARVYGPALLGGDERTTGVQIIGLLPEREAEFRPFLRQLVDGRWLGGTAAGEIVLGEALAQALAVKTGDQVVAVTQSVDGSMGNALYEVVGTIRTGSPMVDRSGALMHLADAQALLALEGRAHEITLLGADDEDETVDALKTAVLPATGELLVRTWYEVDPGTASLFGIQAIALSIFVSLFMAIAAVGVVNTLLMSVLERTRELGVLRALGVRPSMLVSLVVSEALLIAAFAVAGGGLVGLAGDAWLVLQGIDLSVSGKGMASASVQFDAVLRGQITAWGLLFPVAAVFVFTFMASWWPAWRVARLEPLDAIRDL